MDGTPTGVQSFNNVDRTINDMGVDLDLVGFTLWLTVGQEVSITSKSFLELQLASSRIYTEDSALATVSTFYHGTGTVANNPTVTLGNFRDPIFTLEKFKGLVGSTTVESEIGALYLNLRLSVIVASAGVFRATSICTLWFSK